MVLFNGAYYVIACLSQSKHTIIVNLKARKCDGARSITWAKGVAKSIKEDNPQWLGVELWDRQICKNILDCFWAHVMALRVEKRWICCCCCYRTVIRHDYGQDMVAIRQPITRKRAQGCVSFQEYPFAFSLRTRAPDDWQPTSTEDWTVLVTDIEKLNQCSPHFSRTVKSFV